jgi:hypothetical protein
MDLEGSRNYYGELDMWNSRYASDVARTLSTWCVLFWTIRRQHVEGADLCEVVSGWLVEGLLSDDKAQFSANSARSGRAGQKNEASATLVRHCGQTGLAIGDLDSLI